MFQHLSDKPFSRMLIFSILLMAGLFAIISAPAHAITITGNTPVSDATNVATDSDIVVKFDQSVAAATVEADMFAVKGSSSSTHEISTPDVSGSNITIQTETEFIPGETVTVTVSPGGIEDSSGNPLTEPSKWEWKFVIVDGLSGVSPETNAVKISATSKITLKFSKDVVTGTVSSSMFSIGASVSGSHGFEMGISKNTVTLTPATAFVAGESVSVTVNTSGISLMEEEGGTISAKAETRQWQFVIESSGNTNYSDSGQSLGGAPSNDVAIGDVDGDGDIDAFVVNAPEEEEEQTGANVVWKNNEGRFSDSGQALGSAISYGVMMKDLDGDGDIDAFVTNVSDPDNGLTGANKVWKNNGKGTFTDSGQNLGTSDTYNVALGDLDADGDMDAFVVNVSDFDKDLDGANKIWRNDGSGNFTDSGQSLGASDSHGLALGDLDGDGDLDAFVANYEGPDKVWKNNGSGVFTDSGQALGNSASRSVSLGDLDRDGDLENLGGSSSAGIALSDLDGDNDLDAFMANYSQGNRVWLNNSPPEIEEGSSITVEMDENAYPTPFSLTLHASDMEGGGLSWSLVSSPSHGKAYLRGGTTGASQEIRYNPDAYYSGSDSFDIQVSDGADNSLITVNVEINPNVPEITEGESVTVEMDEDGDPIGFILTLHASDHSDPDGENLVWSIAPRPVAIGDPETNGTGNEAVIAYAPEPNYNGTDTFGVQVTDGAGGYDFIGVSVSIRPVNDLPEIPQDVENLVIPAPQANDLTLTLDDLPISINDPDSFYPGDFTLKVQDRENYARSGNTITPSPDFYGTLTVPVILNDGSGDTDVFNLSVKIVRPGDISGDNVLGIGDVILAFQVLTGTDLGEIAIYSAADVNGDGSIGVAEIIFALTAISTEG
ncbi:MAG: hypothetical protein B6245_23195 [Desulfobacteraceae bacterium 4572_88]|nr:MAG: hypothetical protein B6245_23195 [Desulfobacteraceae bacterium 4572_88]